MTREITIRISVPDGVDVKVEQGAPVYNSAPPQAVVAPPTASECPDHHKPFKSNSRGWYCPTPVGEDGNGVKQWCQRKP